MAQLKAGSTIGGKVIASLAALYDHSLDETGDVHGAVSANTANMIVRRDASGNFTAGTITAALTGNVSGSAATVTGAAQPAITSLGTLTELQIDNVNINGGIISSTTGSLYITPVAGSSLRLDGHWSIDGEYVECYQSKDCYIDPASAAYSIHINSVEVSYRALKNLTLVEIEGSLDMSGSSGHFKPPDLTTTERDALSSPAEGWIIYNTTNDTLEQYDGSDWVSLADIEIESVTATSNDTPFSANHSLTCVLTRAGNIVTMTIPAVTGTINNTTSVFQWTGYIPSQFRPAVTKYFLVIVTNNTAVYGRATVGYDGTFIVGIGASGANFSSASNTGGFAGTSLSWAV